MNQYLRIIPTNPDMSFFKSGTKNSYSDRTMWFRYYGECYPLWF